MASLLALLLGGAYSAGGAVLAAGAYSARGVAVVVLTTGLTGRVTSGAL